MSQAAIKKTRSRAPARWLVLALSGLTTAVFLGAILKDTNQEQHSAAAPAVATSNPVIETTSARQVLSSSLQSAATAPLAVPTRSPRLRTRGS